jgi:hypothetical protein
VLVYLQPQYQSAIGLRAELAREWQMIAPDKTCVIEGRLPGIKDLD